MHVKKLLAGKVAVLGLWFLLFAGCANREPVSRSSKPVHLNKHGFQLRLQLLSSAEQKELFRRFSGNEKSAMPPPHVSVLSYTLKSPQKNRLSSILFSDAVIKTVQPQKNYPVWTGKAFLHNYPPRFYASRAFGKFFQSRVRFSGASGTNTFDVSNGEALLLGPGGQAEGYLVIPKIQSPVRKLICLLPVRRYRDAFGPARQFLLKSTVVLSYGKL